MSRLPPRQQVLAATATPTRVNAAASRRQSAAATTSNKYRALCTPSRASTAPKPKTLERLLITHGKTDDATKKRKCDPMPMASRKISMSMSNTGGIATTGGTDEAVKVAVRVRPFAPEGNKCADRAWGVSTEQNSIVELSSESNKDPYEYDQVFGEDSNTRTIYDALVSGVVSSVAKDGINGTVFTYGQTGSGKTFTMQGCKKSKSDGIVQLAARDIFQSIEERQKMNDDNDNKDDAACTVRVSYVEIYNEELRDLLKNDRSRKLSSSLEIREDKQGVIIVDGLKEVVVKTLEELMKIFNAGEKKRSVGSTKMNDRSSRSHAILSITLERKTTTSAPIYDADEQKENSDYNRATSSNLVVVKTTSTLNLVDLAGSESVRHTNAVGKQKDEGGMINRSLLTLSMVLTSLGKKSPEQHIKYRNSKLTRILKPSLSGNARMVVVCCISPSSKYIQETQSTLHFALRAKLVKTNANINETVEGADAAAQLKVELGRSRNESNSLNEQLREQKTMIYALKEEIDELKKQHAEELGRSRSEVHALEGQLRELKASTALREHKSEITNIATSANDDDCQTFEKYDSLADNSTTDFGYSDSKDDDISIRSDSSDHSESINFSEEEEKTMLTKEEKVVEAEEEVIYVCDFGGYGIEEERDDITITNSTDGAPATTRRSGTSRNHSVIDLSNNDEEYIDNEIVEIEDGSDGKIVPTTVKENEDDGDKNEELEFLDLDETHGFSTTTSRTSIATIASTNFANCEEEEEEEEEEEDGNDGRDNSGVEEYEWSEEDDSSKTNSFIDSEDDEFKFDEDDNDSEDEEFEFNEDDNSYGTCEDEEEEEEGNDGRENSDAVEYEWDEEDGTSSETRKSLNKRTNIDAAIYCGSRRCSTVIHCQEQEVEDKEDDNDTNSDSCEEEINGKDEFHSEDVEYEFNENGTSRTIPSTTCGARRCKKKTVNYCEEEEDEEEDEFSNDNSEEEYEVKEDNSDEEDEFDNDEDYTYCSDEHTTRKCSGAGICEVKNPDSPGLKTKRASSTTTSLSSATAASAQQTQLNKKKLFRWEERFNEFVKFVRINKHCNVPFKHPLVNWLHRQRHDYKRKRLSKYRYDKLQEIGFDFNPRQKSWEESFANLEQYKQVHGHCDVPQHWEPDLALGGWVKYQRIYYMRFLRGDADCRGMNEERIRKLNDLEFVWIVRSKKEQEGKQYKRTSNVTTHRK